MVFWSSMLRNMLLIGGCFLHVLFLSFIRYPICCARYFFFHHSICFSVLKIQRFELRKLIQKFFVLNIALPGLDKMPFWRRWTGTSTTNATFFPLFEKKISHNGLKIHFLYGSHKNCYNIIDSVQIIACAVVISSCGIQTQQRLLPLFDMDLLKTQTEFTPSAESVWYNKFS